MGRILYVTIVIVGFVLFEANTQTVGRFRRPRRQHSPSTPNVRGPTGLRAPQNSLRHLQDLLCQYCIKLINSGRMVGTLSDCSWYCSMRNITPCRPYFAGGSDLSA